MSTDKPNRPEPGKEQPAATPGKPEADEIDDEELQSISGGLASTGGTTVQSTAVCVTQL